MHMDHPFSTGRSIPISTSRSNTQDHPAFLHVYSDKKDRGYLFENKIIKRKKMAFFHVATDALGGEWRRWKRKGEAGAPSLAKIGCGACSKEGCWNYYYFGIDESELSSSNVEMGYWSLGTGRTFESLTASHPESTPLPWFWVLLMVRRSNLLSGRRHSIPGHGCREERGSLQWTRTGYIYQLDRHLIKLVVACLWSFSFPANDILQLRMYKMV